MPSFLEDKLKARYGARSKTPYKIMNARGYMRGNKITAAGRDAEAKHKADVRTARRTGSTVAAASAARRRHTRRSSSRRG